MSKPRKQEVAFMHKHTHKNKHTHSKRFKELIQALLKLKQLEEARQCKEKTTATDPKKKNRTKENKDHRERDREKIVEMNRRTDRQIHRQTDRRTDR